MLKKAETIARSRGVSAEPLSAFVVSIPATITAALGPGPRGATLDRQYRPGGMGFYRADAGDCSVAWRATGPPAPTVRRRGKMSGGKAGGSLTHRAEHSRAYAGFALSAIAREINPAIEVAAELRPQSRIGVVGV
jgi:hypothetical protein